MKTIISVLILAISLGTYAYSTLLNINKIGDGKQAVILISGLACKNEVWDQTIQSLPGNTSIYSIDYYEDKEDALRSIHEIADEALDLIKEEELETPIIIGHSLGGAIALDIASRNVVRIKQLIIIDSYPSASALANPDFKTNPENDCTPFIQQFTNMTDEEFRAFQQTNYSQMTKDETARKKLVDWVVEYDRTHYAALLCDYLNMDLRETIKQIGCPVLILASSAMKPFEEQLSEQYKGLKEHELSFSESGLHFLMIDDFDWYSKAINELMEN